MKSQILPKIKEIFFDPYPQVEIKENLEGQLVLGGTICLGLRAGGEIGESNLCHEMAHLAEIDRERVFSQGWGLKNGKPIDFGDGTIIYQRTTAQHIDREIRVWAYQLNLHRYFQIDEDASALASSAPYLPDTYLAFDRLPEIKSIQSNKQRNNVFADWVAREIEHQSEIYTFERFCHQWQNKLVRKIG